MFEDFIFGCFIIIQMILRRDHAEQRDRAYFLRFTFVQNMQAIITNDYLEFLVNNYTWQFGRGGLNVYDCPQWRRLNNECVFVVYPLNKFFSLPQAHSGLWILE